MHQHSAILIHGLLDPMRAVYRSSELSLGATRSLLDQEFEHLR
jgi:hypothetical protein